MARPTKQGIDYFPVDTEFDDDIQLLIAEIGAEGLGILLTIWQAIYKSNGYYVEYNERLPLKIKQKCFSSVENIVNVVENAVKFEIFNNNIYKKHHILTSRGIQKRYFAAARAKKQIEIIPGYILIDVNSIGNAVNVVGNAVNVVGNATKEEVKEEVNIYKEESFNKFYSMYPKKVERKDAIKAWNVLMKNKTPVGDVLLATKNYVNECKRENRDSKYIKHPSTFLRADRWCDYLNNPTKICLHKSCDKYQYADQTVKDLERCGCERCLTRIGVLKNDK